jgi:hypothetical protein
LNVQPEIGLAPYSKSFKLKVCRLYIRFLYSFCTPSIILLFQEKYDKYLNTYEQDPEFLKFKQRFDNPERIQQQQQQLQVTRFCHRFYLLFDSLLENCS